MLRSPLALLAVLACSDASAGPLASSSNATVMWLRVENGSAVATFSATAGGAGEEAPLAQVANKTDVYAEPATSAKPPKSPFAPLAMTTTPMGGGGFGLIHNLAVHPPFTLRLNCTSGLDPAKPERLLKYHASADAVMRPSGWAAVQSTSAAIFGAHAHALSITLRDPYMSGALGGEGIAIGPPFPAAPSSADQCPPAQAWHDGDACVVAVVRFAGALLTAPVNISTFASTGPGGTGLEYKHALSAGGVTILRVPAAATMVFARVLHTEAVNGTYAGRPYAEIAHWATTSAVLRRPPPPTAHAPPPPPPPPAPPALPPPPEVPPWWTQIHVNAFGGAFAGALVAVLLMGCLGVTGKLAHRHRSTIADAAEQMRVGIRRPARSSAEPNPRMTAPMLAGEQ